MPFGETWCICVLVAILILLLTYKFGNELIH